MSAEETELQPLDKRFGRLEKLKSKKYIDLLFEKGASISAGPIRMIYYKEITSTRAMPQVLFSVSKRNFKRAVDRNRIKRQLREVYRLSKGIYFPKGTINPYLVAFIYTPKEKIAYNIIEKKLNLALERLSKGGK
jgi:ribonuclease P protein component